MKAVVLVTVFAVAMPALAHDLWIVPGKFGLRPEERIRIFINSGDEFPKSASLVGEHRIERFSMVTARGEESLSGLLVDGRSLTVEFSAADAGTVVLALATKSRLVRLKADEFNEYLTEEGLPQILTSREEHDEMTQPVVERYTKWAKAIIQVGEQGDETWKDPVGHRIEIVPEIDTYGLQSGASLPFRVLFEGEPLPGVTVTGTRAGGGRNETHEVTDADGRARLRITEAGRWYLRTIHMVRIEEESDIQWESFWATFTFEVGRPAPSRLQRPSSRMFSTSPPTLQLLESKGPGARGQRPEARGQRPEARTHFQLIELVPLTAHWLLVTGYWLLFPGSRSLK